MSRQPPFSPVAVTLSTRKTMLPASAAQHWAADVGLNGLDIDATSAIGVWFAVRLGKPGNTSVPVRSVWLAAEELPSLQNHRVMKAVMEYQPDATPLVVAMLSNTSTLRDLARTTGQERFTSQPWPIALGLPSSALRGGRPHLVQLGGIRRFAEEWDLTIAVDLSGQFDPTWEAEAAVSRLGDRLSVLRISSAAPSRTAVGRDRVACRALHAAIDRDQQLDIAITPGRSVPFPITPRVALHGASRAIDYIQDRAALHAQALRDGISRYEGSPTSRGS